MFWKDKVYVFDDVVSSSQQEEIEAHFTKAVPWYFVEDITSVGDAEEHNKRPGFSHPLARDGQLVASKRSASYLQAILGGVFKKLFEESGVRGQFAIIQSRAFLQLPLSTLTGPEYDHHHIDTFQKHLSVLYYVCDADGETVLFENMYQPLGDASMEEIDQNRPELSALKEKLRVEPKRGRVVVFDGYHWHTATQPKKELRCVINTNIDHYA